MRDARDSLELGGVRFSARSSASAKSNREARKFLLVWYRCCHAYGRMTRNKEQTAYEGRCPKCGAKVRATIGAGGTAQRMFEAR